MWANNQFILITTDDNNHNPKSKVARSGGQKGKVESMLNEYLRILDYTKTGIDSLHFAFTSTRSCKIIYINDIKFNISQWNEVKFELFLKQIHKQKIGSVTFNPIPSSLIHQVLAYLPDGITELSFGCCDMDHSLMTAIADYLNANSNKSVLETFQIWDAAGIEMIGMTKLLASLSNGYDNLKVVQFITESGMSPLNNAFQSILTSIISNLPYLEDLILNSQEVGDPECAIGVIRALSNHNHLKVLDISINTVADEILEPLGNFLLKNSSLQRMYLWGNYFLKDGMKYLVEPLSKHHSLDRLHIHVPNRFSLENCHHLGRIIKTNKSLTEIDGVDYNDEFYIDLEHALILMDACNYNSTLSRIDFFLHEDQYPILSNITFSFKCKSDGCFSQSLSDYQTELDFASVTHFTTLFSCRSSY